jgi:phage N-6-adenine-methyltransferase
MPNDEWYTPPYVLEAVRDVLGEIDLDPASSYEAQKRVRANHYFTDAQDALAQHWWGRIFLNPPYSRGKIGKFVDKLLEEINAGRAKEVILLVDNCADTQWFRKAARAATTVCFTEGRIKFITPEGKAPGSPPKGQCFLYYGAHPERFKNRFQRLGLIGKLQRRKFPSRRRRLLSFLRLVEVS